MTIIETRGSSKDTSYYVDALNYLTPTPFNKPFRCYSMESKIMLDITNYKPEELMFRNAPNRTITQIIDITARGKDSQCKCLVLYTDTQGLLDVMNSGINGLWSWGSIHDLDVILKPKKVMYIKPLMQLLKEHSFITSETGLNYHSGATSAFISYDTMGKPLDFADHTLFVKLFCEEKEV